MDTYYIKRFYHPSQKKKDRVIKRGLTLQEAQDHCSREDTQKKGVYFDGYDKEV